MEPPAFAAEVDVPAVLLRAAADALCSSTAPPSDLGPVLAVMAVVLLGLCGASAADSVPKLPNIAASHDTNMVYGIKTPV